MLFFFFFFRNVTAHFNYNARTTYFNTLYSNSTAIITPHVSSIATLTHRQTYQPSATRLRKPFGAKSDAICKIVSRPPHKIQLVNCAVFPKVFGNHNPYPPTLNKIYFILSGIIYSCRIYILTFSVNSHLIALFG